MIHFILRNGIYRFSYIWKVMHEIIAEWWKNSCKYTHALTMIFFDIWKPFVLCTKNKIFFTILHTTVSITFIIPWISTMLLADGFVIIRHRSNSVIDVSTFTSSWIWKQNEIGGGRFINLGGKWAVTKGHLMEQVFLLNVPKY